MKIEELATLSFPLVNRFFKENGHKGKARGNERVFVLRDDEGKIVAALRARPKNTAFLLRSVQVDRTQYGNGIGSLLVREAVTKLLPSQCWCYPFNHLKRFYEGCGFQLCDSKEVCEDIKAPYERYIQQGQKLLLMASRP